MSTRILTDRAGLPWWMEKAIKERAERESAKRESAERESAERESTEKKAPKKKVLKEKPSKENMPGIRKFQSPGIFMSCIADDQNPSASSTRITWILPGCFE